MSFLSNILNKFKKVSYPEIEDDVPTYSIPDVVSHSNKTVSPTTIHNPYVYDSPTYSGIRNNISVHQASLLIQYHDLAYVASTITDSIVVGAPVKQVHTGKLADEYNRIYEENSEFARSNFNKNIKVSRKLDTHLYTIGQLFANIREIYPDFGQNMKDKVSPENYELYHSNMAKLKKSLLVEVHDVPFKSLSESLSEAQRKIAETIDTFDFSRACEIEDRFIISEIDKFFTQFSQAPHEKQAIAKKPTIKLENGTKINTIDLANKVRAERVARLKKYSEISQLHEKSSGKTTTSPEDHSEH